MKSEVYVSEDKVFLDADVLNRVKRKTKRMRGHLSTRFMAEHYQSCLEELGLWEVEDV